MRAVRTGEHKPLRRRKFVDPELRRFGSINRQNHNQQSVITQMNTTSLSLG